MANGYGNMPDKNKYKVYMKVEATKRWSFHLSNLVLESISHESYAGCLKEEAPATCQPQSESLWASLGCTKLEQELAIFGAAEAARIVLTCIDRSTKKHALGCSMTQGKCFLAGRYQLSRVSQPGIPRWLVGILKNGAMDMVRHQESLLHQFYPKSCCYVLQLTVRIINQYLYR